MNEVPKAVCLCMRIDSDPAALPPHQLDLALVCLRPAKARQSWMIESMVKTDDVLLFICSSYEFDVTKCMFSSGNITEKLRVAGFDCRGETVVDLYAGVETL